MLISRRMSLACASAAAACAVVPLPSLAQALGRVRSRTATSQLVQHLLLHVDETGGVPYAAALSLEAPATAWIAIGHSENEFLATLGTYRSRGYGLRRVNAFQTHQGMHYATIWQFEAPMPALVRQGMTHAEFLNANGAAAVQGLELTHIDACATRSGARFAAIWDKSGGRTQKVFTELTAADFRAHMASLAANGFRPRQVAGYASRGDARFAAIFINDSKPAVARVALPASEFYTQSRHMTSRGHALTDASGYVVGAEPMFTAVWEEA